MLEQTTLVDLPVVTDVMTLLAGLDLLADGEAAEVRAMFEPDFPLADVLCRAESIHLHIKVADVDALPQDTLVAAGTRPVSEADGYVKYPFAGGVNVIFSSIPVAEDDLLGDQPLLTAPVLDHRGIDLRATDDTTRSVFESVAGIAASRSWRQVRQGGSSPVYCCHTEVAEKLWLYPLAGDAGQHRPIEVPFGELKMHEGNAGCDLRPIDPAHPRASEVAAGHDVGKSCSSTLSAS